MALLIAETSKTPFYIAGGVLALWAVVLSAIGLSRDRFPGGGGGERGVLVISGLLMVGAMGTAVATASIPENEGKSQLKPVPTNAEAAAQAIAPASTPPPTPVGGAATAAIAVKADPQRLAFQEKSLRAKAGVVTINFTNPSQIPHDVHIQGPGGKDLGGTKEITGGKAVARIKLPAGTYTFFCSVPGHRQAGMQGTLTVQ